MEKEILYQKGITDEIFNHAEKMDVDLLKLFHDKIFYNYTIKGVEEITRCLLGIYGNFIATYYFKSLGYDVENEVSIKDNDGNETTKADISFLDHNNTRNYFEVKAVSQILDSVKNYKDEDSSYEKIYLMDKKLEEKKYEQIGKKLIKQVEKLKIKKGIVGIVVFNGCIIDDLIKEKLKKLNVKIYTIALNINELENNIRNMVYKIRDSYVNDNIYTSKRRLMF